VDSTSCTQETVGWQREVHELFGEMDAAFVNGGRGIHILVAEKIVVAVAAGGIAIFDGDSVCPGADVLCGTMDVSALVVSQLGKAGWTGRRSVRRPTGLVSRPVKKPENRRWVGRG